MILPDKEIAKELHYGKLGIEPFDESNIQPASYDVRLGNEITRFHGEGIVDPLEDDPAEITERYSVTDDGGIILRPGEFALATTKETVRMPDNLAANVDGRSSYGRYGLAVHITAGYIDPGFRGQITLELKNNNSHAIELRPGECIAQLVFKRLSEPCNVPYGDERGSHYQGQKGAEPARLHEDE